MNLKSWFYALADIVLPKDMGIKDEAGYLKPPRQKDLGRRVVQFSIVAGMLLLAGILAKSGIRGDQSSQNRGGM